MAKLPIRLAGRAAPQIGGPQSRASVSGLGALGKGISDVGIAAQKKATAAENFDVSKDALKIKEAMILNQDSVLSNSTNGQQVNEETETFQKDIINEFSAGKSKRFRDKLEKATLTMFSKSSIQSAQAGINIDVNNLMVDVGESIDAAVRIARANPEDADSVSALIDDISDKLGESVGISQAAKNKVKKEFDSQVALATLNGFMDQGIHGAMFVKRELETVKFNARLDAKQIDYLKAQANAQIIQGQKEILASADTEISAQLGMEQGGRDTGLTPEQMENQLQGFALPQHEINRRVAQVKRNKFYGQEIRLSAQGPQFQLEGRKRQIQDVVESLSGKDINTASDFAIEAFAQLDALNDLETQKRDDAHGYALEWVPTLREQDKKINQLNVALQNAAPENEEAIKLQIRAERAKFAANLQEQGALVFGDPNAIPIAGKNAVAFFKSQIDSNLPDVQAELVSQQLQAYGPGAASQVMRTFFNEPDQQAWQYIAPILGSNRRGAEDAIAAHKNWNENKKLLENDQLSSIKSESKNLMAEFGLTFQGGLTGGTLQSGIGLVQEIAADQMLRGIDQDSALANAVDIVTGNFVIVDTTRMSKANMSKFPNAQRAIVNAGSQRFNRALSAAAGLTQFGGDEDNNDFNQVPLTSYTSPDGMGIVLFAGNGLTASPVVDDRGQTRVITWDQLNVIGSRWPKSLTAFEPLDRSVPLKAGKKGRKLSIAQASEIAAENRLAKSAAFDTWLTGFLKNTQLSGQQ